MKYFLSVGKTDFHEQALELVMTPLLPSSTISELTKIVVSDYLLSSVDSLKSIIFFHNEIFFDIL